MNATRQSNRQECIDTFFWKHGPCCAGCDWWRHVNSLVGECRRSAPVSGRKWLAMLNMESVSLPVGAGHVLTRRDHHCGEFRDTFDWSSLPLPYLKRVGAADAVRRRNTHVEES